MLKAELTEDVIGAAMKVLNVLRPGLDEKLYEIALSLELRRRGHRIAQQQSFPVRYEGETVGTLIPDLVVDEAVIVDTKVVSEFTDTHLAQMIGYLNITGLRVGLLLNFKYGTLRIKRVVG
ncbi:MAG: GxxExxY protein [Verrucomicrobia bacterium]|nr:GxxExxY protein [Verrucomicrobiota bacterium]